MTFLIGLYLVGYFISFGMTLSAVDKNDWATYMAAFFISFLSWINIGTVMGDFLREYFKEIEGDKLSKQTLNT